MRRLRTWLNGLATGAGLMYLYDPERGNRRRSMLRDQLTGTLNDGQDAFAKAWRDLNNRTTGIMAEARARMRGEQVPDSVLAERVRSKLGLVVSHPGAIEVSIHDGRVTLRGPILASEVTPLLARVGTVRGVTSVDNQLEVHQTPDGVPALQGNGRAERGKNAWTPSARLIATLVGGMLTLGGLRQGGLMGTARGLLGFGLLARGLTNKDLKILVGLTETGTIEVREGISVNAPVDEVFRFWENYQNFPRFMSNVLEVSDRGNGRSHWVVEGPAGTRVEWDAVLTNLVRNQLLAWESVPGSEVAQTGMVRFHPTPNGGTQINIDLSYTPPAGILGHMVATFFGVNPEQSMNEDLVRFKSLIEYGKTTAHCETVTRDEVLPDKGDGSVSAGQPSQQANQEADQPMNQSTDKPTNQPSGSEPESRRESEQPAGGAGRIDKLEPPTGVFPASDIEEAPEDAKLQGMASWGQGERGAAGYEDHGESELWGLTNEEEDKGSPEKPKEENQK